VTTKTRLELPQLTVENLMVRVRVDDDSRDPTPWLADAAWTPPDTEPASGDWFSVSWDAGGPPYRLLIPTDQNAGTYRLYVRVHAPGETPVRFVGLVDFT
jgi:hypothetical protein